MVLNTGALKLISNTGDVEGGLTASWYAQGNFGPKVILETCLPSSMKKSSSPPIECEAARVRASVASTGFFKRRAISISAL